MNEQQFPRMGIDIVEVERMSRFKSTPGLTEQLFTPGEISYCKTRRRPHASFAACFAAKEAFLKASGLGLHAGMIFSEIEIDFELPNRPQLVLHGALKARLGVSTLCHLSMGESGDLACAVVALEEKRIS